MPRPRRHDLPEVLRKREELMRQTMNGLERVFPPDTGLALLAFDFGDGGHMSWVSNAQRATMIDGLKELVESLEMGTDDTAGRGEA